jgi:hypothetical protein
MSAQPLNVEAVSQQTRLSLVVRFHQRRLNEMSQYDQALRTIVSLDGKTSKQELAYERLLRQPASYQVLSLIWAASPWCAGIEPEADWPCTQTVYGISRSLAASDEGLNKTVNYVDRVIDASEYYGLVRRERVEDKNKILVRGTALLHNFMCEFALQSLVSNVDQRNG